MKKLLATAFLAMFALSATVQAAKPAPAPAPAEEGEAVVYSVGMTGVT